MITGLVQQEIKELRQLLKDYRAGKVASEQIQDEISIYSQINKRSNLLLQAIQTSAKFGNGTVRRIINSNLIGNEQAIDLALDYVGNDKVVCTAQDSVISRDECLDFSGSPPEGYDCSGCKHFRITRKLLLDNNE